MVKNKQRKKEGEKVKLKVSIFFIEKLVFYGCAYKKKLELRSVIDLTYFK